MIRPGAIRSRWITQAARGEDCTLQIVGFCNGDRETTVFAHLPDESKGGSRKSDDICGAFACSECHRVIDSEPWRIREHFDWYLRRAMTRTWRRLIQKGVIEVKGMAKP